MASDAAVAHKQDYVNFFNTKKGIMSWVWTIDHKRIGIMYMCAITFFFLLAVCLGLLIRGELMVPNAMTDGKPFLDVFSPLFGGVTGGDLYNRVLTLHGIIMIFLFIIPSIPAIFGNFFLPIMIGADDVAFPKLNLLSWYCYVLGAIVAIISVAVGGIDTGWTFYAPYSANTSANLYLPLTAAFILGWSSILTGINFVVTIHRLRVKEMGWFEMPLFCWALYATSWIQVVATPVVGITLILLMMERFMGIGIFDPAKGGDPVLFQHMFWIYSHPAVYIMILPAMGVVSEIIPVFSRKTIFGYKFIAFSSIAIALIGSLVWAHHMFTAGMAYEARVLFSLLTFFVAVPSAIKVFNWIFTMFRGSIKMDPPMVFAVIFIILFSIGGFSGLVNGALATDVHIHDTSFVVGHFHYVMFGGTGVIFFGAMLYWFPKMFGRMYNKTIINISAIMFFVGFNTLYGGMKLMGLNGMPRRYADYVVEYAQIQKISTHGSWLMVAGIFLMFGTLFYSVFKGKKAPDNPWGGATLEWTVQTPPPLLNFDEQPENIRGAYDYPEVVAEGEPKETVGV